MPAPALPPPVPVPATPTVLALLDVLRQEEQERPPASGEAAAPLAPQFPPGAGAEPIAQSIRFAARGVEIAEDSLLRLAPIARALARLAQESPALVVEVTGHADASEGAGAGELATRRAELVRAYLASRAVPRARIRLSSDVLRGGEASGNRRVDVRTAH